MEYSRIPKNGFQRRTIKVDYYYYHRGQIHTKCNSIRVIKRESENYDTHTKRVRRQTDRQRQRHRETERGRERERETERDTHRQTHRHRDTERDRERLTDGEKERYRERITKKKK